MTWDNLLSDPYVSKSFDELHARLENYQIYSLAWCDQSLSRTSTEHLPAVALPPIELQDVYNYYASTPYPINRPASVISSVSTEIRNGAMRCIAFQSFDVSGRIPFDFAEIVRAYPVYQLGAITYNYSPFSRPNFGAATVYLSTEYPIGRRKADYRLLVNGNPLDTRTVPEITGRATTARKIKIECYAKNYLETNPRLDTLDWRSISIDVRAGEFYRVPFVPILGTLVVDSQTKSELIAVSIGQNHYPLRYFFFDQLRQLFDEWDALYPPPEPPAPPPEPLASTLTLNGAFQIIKEVRTFVTLGQTSRVSIQQLTPIVRIMAANNDVWGHGSPTEAKNRPPDDHPLFEFDHQTFFEESQPDGSFGTYMTDSPRIVNIDAALGATFYATDPATGLAREANLGWAIMKILGVLGIRRQPNGKFLTTTDSKKYDRTRENSPTWKQGDYGINEWGKYGLAFKYLPTTYIDGQRQDDQYDIVHDYPQLLAAIVDQLDHSLNLQHGSEVRIPVGKDIQAYPNQGAATIDTAARIIQLERMVEQLLVMNIETSNSVRELFAGIGIPITTKAVKVDVGGQIRDIQYPGYQQSKPSMAESIGSLKSNLGLVIGALMPRKSPKDSAMNPWNWRKK